MLHRVRLPAVAGRKRVCSAVRKSSQSRSSLLRKSRPVADQGEAVDVAVLDDLERAVALPHASPGAEGPDHAPDQRAEVEIRRRLLAQGVEGADLDEDLGMPGQPAEGLDVGVADRHPVRADPARGGR